MHGTDPTTHNYGDNSHDLWSKKYYYSGEGDYTAFMKAKNVVL